MYFETIINRTSSSGMYGTATYCSINGIDVAAKTGTTNENYDRWLAGFTPYYTAVCWFGFDMNESINFNNRNPAGLIWSNVMKKIHSELPDAKFEMSDGVTTRIICRDSGKLANSNCPNTFTEYFLDGTIPEACTQHSGSNLNNKQKPSTNKNTTNSNTSENKSTTPKNTTPQEVEDEIQNTNLNTNITSNTTNSNIENTNIDNSSSSSNNITNNASNVQNTSTNTVNNATSNSTTSNNLEVNSTPTDNELSN